MSLKVSNKNRKKKKISKTQKVFDHIIKNCERYYFAFIIIVAIFIYL